MDNINFIFDILKVCNHKYIKNTLFKLFAEDIFNSSTKTVKRRFEEFKTGNFNQIEKNINKTEKNINDDDKELLKLIKKLKIFLNILDHISSKRLKIYIKKIINSTKTQKDLFSKLIQLQYEIYLMFINYHETKKLDKKTFETLLLSQIFTKNEFLELFYDMLNGKNMFKYQQKIVNFLFKDIKYVNLLEENYRFEEEDNISTKEQRRFFNADILFTHNNFAEFSYQSETFEYLKYNSIWCFEKIKKKFINTS